MLEYEDALDDPKVCAALVELGEDDATELQTFIEHYSGEILGIAAYALSVTSDTVVEMADYLCERHHGVSFKVLEKRAKHLETQNAAIQKEADRLGSEHDAAQTRIRELEAETTDPNIVPLFQKAE